MYSDLEPLGIKNAFTVEKIIFLTCVNFKSVFAEKKFDVHIIFSNII